MSDNVELIRRAYEAFAAGDIPSLLGLMDERMEWHEAEHATYWSGRPYVGPQAVLDGVLAPIGDDFDGFRVDVERIVGCGDTVLAQARYRATARATGRPLDAQVAHVWEVRDGRILRFEQYTDTWQMAQVTDRAPSHA